MGRSSRVRNQEGLTLVETMIAVVILALLGLLVFAGVQGALCVSQGGKLKTDGVALLKSVTEDISATPSDLKAVADGKERIYPPGKIGVDPSYEARYSVDTTGYGVYRLEVRVIRDDKEIASNRILVRDPDFSG